MNKIVSIIVPTYKGSDIIDGTVKSLLNQTYRFIEIIVVDDNGLNTDEQIRTYKVLEKFILNNKIKYIAHDVNKNGSSARNTGIKNASGEYIAFLDDDDEMIAEKIEKQVEFLEKNPNIGLVYTALQELYDDGTIKNIISPNFVDNHLYDYLCCKLYICSSSILIRRNIVDKVGYWDVSFKRHQDLEYVSRILAISKIGYIDEVLVLKKIKNRNLPVDPYKVEEYRLYFLKKMQAIMDNFSKKQKREILFYNYLQIGKAFLKNKNYFKGVYYAIKSHKTIKMLFFYVKDGIKYKQRKRRK